MKKEGQSRLKVLLVFITFDFDLDNPFRFIDDEVARSKKTNKKERRTDRNQTGIRKVSDNKGTMNGDRK